MQRYCRRSATAPPRAQHKPGTYLRQAIRRQHLWATDMSRAVALLILAAIASPFATAAAALSTGPSRSQLAPRHIPGAAPRPWQLPDHHDADAVDSAYAPRRDDVGGIGGVAGSSRRGLLHRQSGKFSTLPVCHRCRWHDCTPSGVFQRGHCRVGNARPRKHCFKSKSSGTASHIFTKRRLLSTQSSTEAQIEAVFERDMGRDTLVIRGVACFSDSDCALPPADFVAINGSAPASAGGSLSASCIRGEPGPDGRFPEDEPGICMCVYDGARVTTATDNSAAGSASASSREMMFHRGGSGGRSLLQGLSFQRRNFKRGERSSGPGVTTAAQINATSAVFVDVCIKVPATDMGPISNDSLGVLVPDSAVTNTRGDVDITLGLPDGEVDVAEGSVSPGFLLPDDFVESAYGEYEQYEYTYEYSYVDDEEGEEGVPTVMAESAELPSVGPVMMADSLMQPPASEGPAATVEGQPNSTGLRYDREFAGRG
eukprot:jgi/Ulvmu1/4939/UM205_0001.1